MILSPVQFGVRAAGLAAVTATAMAVLIALTLAEHQSQRAAELRQKVQVARTVAARAPPLLQAGLCNTALDDAMREIAGALRAMSLGAGLTIAALEVTSADTSAPPGLAAASVHLKVRGGEAGLANFLRRASTARLPVFLDAVDLKRAGPTVEADFTGRLLCRRSA